MQRRNFDSHYIVNEHYKRQYKIYAPLHAALKAEDYINDIRCHLDRLGIYVSAHEWPTFIERFCAFNIDGDISLDRRKLMMHKDLSNKHAVQLLGEELQHHPDLLEKLRLILKDDEKARRSRPRKASVKTVRRPLENHWAS